MTLTRLNLFTFIVPFPFLNFSLYCYYYLFIYLFCSRLCNSKYDTALFGQNINFLNLPEYSLSLSRYCNALYFPI